jgi:hypothetical protein
MAVKTPYSDEYLAAILLCDKLVTDRKRLVNGLKERIGNLPEEILKLILESSVPASMGYNGRHSETKNYQNLVLEEFFMKIFKGEITPKSESLQEISTELMISYLRLQDSGKSVHLIVNIRQVLGVQVKYLNQLGYSDLTLDRCAEFLMDMISEGNRRWLFGKIKEII